MKARHLVRTAAMAAITLAGAAGLSPAHASKAPAPTNASISGNWAGYVVPGTGITAVTGNWKVPNAGALPPGVSSTWTGVGGYSTQDLIQAGTQQMSAPFDSVITGGAYSAWYELLPANPVYITNCTGDPSCTVTPGDAMKVTITNTSAQTWTISIADANKWTYSKNVTYASSHSAAEWIHESPSLAGALPVPVGGSGTVTFDGTNNYTSGSVTRTIGQGANAVAVEALPVETTTSALDSEGDGFNVCTYSLSCSPSAS